jgi:hypothetical protein
MESNCVIGQAWGSRGDFQARDEPLPWCIVSFNRRQWLLNDWQIPVVLRQSRDGCPDNQYAQFDTGAVAGLGTAASGGASTLPRRANKVTKSPRPGRCS